jgi:hypothetical protein
MKVPGINLNGSLFFELPRRHWKPTAKLVMLIVMVYVHLSVAWGAESQFEVRERDKHVDVLCDGKVVAEYCYADEKVPHPYWKRICSVSGLQLTRNHPPVEGVDALDHSGMHTGVWLAFGDVNGNDFWRLKAKAIQTEFKLLPVEEQGATAFQVKNEWRTQDESAILLEEITRFRFSVLGQGYLVEWDTELKSVDADVVFGEQEEMGLGLRMAAPVAVDRNLGGRLLDSEGRRNGKEIWGKQVTWCDYAGPIDGRWGGITVLVDSDNGRACRAHARDYGFLALNPFSTKVFTGGEATPYSLPKGKVVRLRFGLYVHESQSENNFSVLPAKNRFDMATP